MKCEHEQFLFVLGVGRTGEGAHFAVAQLAETKGVVDLWQAREWPSDAHILAGGAGAHSGSPREPMRTAQCALVSPSFGFVEPRIAVSRR